MRMSYSLHVLQVFLRLEPRQSNQFRFLFCHINLSLRTNASYVSMITCLNETTKIHCSSISYMKEVFCSIQI